MQLVHIFESAARQYGTEKRVLLLHGPVGSAKSTIVRLLKKGLEAYSKTDDGALYSLLWVNVPDQPRMECPMHEEPLHLIPLDFRSAVLAQLNDGRPSEEHIRIEGELCPACRFVYRR
jgi:serine protein kinase